MKTLAIQSRDLTAFSDLIATKAGRDPRYNVIRKLNHFGIKYAWI
jgi:hypothetical protein